MTQPRYRNSVAGVVFGSVSAYYEHGRGAIRYDFDNDLQRFPTDVTAVWIMLPAGTAPEGTNTRWDVRKPNRNGAQWKLSGTWMRPTLSPSLHWVGMWHGWLRDGQIVSV